MDKPPSWRARKQHLWTSLSLSNPTEEEEGIALDAYILQREATGKSSGSNELNEFRFTNRDLSNLGALANGPFGSVDMVRCRLNNQIYVRKTVEKRVVARNPAQCRPKHERDILVAATQLQSPWAPHLLCTFHTPLNLCYLMEYAEGGSLEDLLESSGQISERDLLWWLPQMIAAIDWCHSQGFCHRDIKPSNFVVTSSCHVHLIDFASSARLLPADEDGVQLIPKESCLVLCGTCDYISPEILAMQEEALIALDRQEEIFVPHGEGGYGRETDWWSLGATAYELVFGVAPFFAKDIRGTYEKIMNFEDNLDFPINSEVSAECVDFISGLLRDAEGRIGRRDNRELLLHRFLKDIPWTIIHSRPAPPWLELPQFEYNMLAHSIKDEDDIDETYSKGFAFSAFFNSSTSSNATNSNQNINATNLTFVRAPSPQVAAGQSDAAITNLPPHLAQYIGFTWGPSIDAFDEVAPPTPLYQPAQLNTLSTPLLGSQRTPLMATKQSNLPGYYQRRSDYEGPSSAPPLHVVPPGSSLVTPVRPSTVPGTMNPPSTIRRTVGGTARKMGTTRAVSELEALKQLGECVRASARKKLNENAGRTPAASGGSSALKRRASWAKMTLDFEKINQPSPSTVGLGESNERKPLVGFKSPTGLDGGLRIFVKDKSLRKPSESLQPSNSRRSFSRKSSVIGGGGGSGDSSRRNSRSYADPVANGDSDQEGDGRSTAHHNGYSMESTGVLLFGAVANEDDTRDQGESDQTVTTDEGPPSPSPTPRPTSALSKRGSTPILTPTPPAVAPATSGSSLRRTSSTQSQSQAQPPFQSHSRSQSQSQLLHVPSGSFSKPSLAQPTTTTGTSATTSIFKPPAARLQGVPASSSNLASAAATSIPSSKSASGARTISTPPTSVFVPAATSPPIHTVPTSISIPTPSKTPRPASTLARQAMLRDAGSKNTNRERAEPDIDSDPDATPRPPRQAQSAPPVFMKPGPPLNRPNSNSNPDSNSARPPSHASHLRMGSYPSSAPKADANAYVDAQKNVDTNANANANGNAGKFGSSATSLEGSLLFGGDTPRANRAETRVDTQRQIQRQPNDRSKQEKLREMNDRLQKLRSDIKKIEGGLRRAKLEL